MAAEGAELVLKLHIDQRGSDDEASTQTSTAIHTENSPRPKMVHRDFTGLPRFRCRLPPTADLKNIHPLPARS
jgi:hypothetical protein